MAEASDPPLVKATADGLPAASPDQAEERLGEELDDAIPWDPQNGLRIVGLGGSAGGLVALQNFFAVMPPDSGMVFVVILHLSPEHESIAAELLQKHTSMRVQQVQIRTKVEPNQVYVIPPGKHLSMADGHLTLSDMGHTTSRHIAVDLFFRTLADTHGPHAAAVVLSGADGDGAIGLKRMKERGGLTVVQSPDEAEHFGMPRASIATGLVDWVLPVVEMPGKLIEYWKNESQIELKVEPDPAEIAAAAPSQSRVEIPLHDILGFLRVRTGHDFIYYKRATVLRRIARRMQVNSVRSPQAYSEFIRNHPAEADALLRDLLISVTNFFRDRDAFTALESQISQLFHGKAPTDTVRVWVPACATGEEAYSVAIMLCEQASRLERPPLLQVFATDLDERAIEVAREGLFPVTITADVSTERLRRFFSKEHGGYRVRREVREIVLFALHDLLKDSPFSRLDLATCRNLLIYLNRDAQARALEIFHFALRPEGILFLGSSESIDEESTMFTVLDKKRRIYRRLPGARLSPPMVPERGVMLRAMLRQVPATAPDLANFPSVLGSRTSAHQTADGIPPSWSSLHFEFLEDLAPPSILVTREHVVVHVSKNAGQFLQVPGGEASMNLLHLVHPMLRLDLRTALYRAAETLEPVEARGLPIELDNKRREINLRIIPSRMDDSGFLLILFLEREPESEAPLNPLSVPSGDAEAFIRRLEQDLTLTQAQLRNVLEQSDASNEELKAANEELQAMNEELRSAGEELETGREELQSVNEELSAVNQELKSKVDELSHSNSDLQNLMASTQIATVFLDRRLCIQRYTPSAVPLFNLIPSDIGRPLSDLTPRLNYADLNSDAQKVLDEMSVVETEVPHTDTRHFLARIFPYRTTDDHIAGVVMTFVDITQRRKSEKDLRESEARFRTVSNVVPDLLYSTDSSGNLLWCNQRWIAYTGQTAEQALGFGWLDAIHPDDMQAAKSEFLACLAKGQPYRGEHRVVRTDGQARWFLVRAEPLRGAEGEIQQWFGAQTDIDDFKKASNRLASSEERLRLLIESAREFAIFSTDLDLNITFWNSGAQHVLGFTEKEILGQSGEIIFTPEDRAAGVPDQERQQALTEGHAMDSRWQQRKDGARFWANGAMMPIKENDGKVVGFVKILRDETGDRESRQVVEESREKLAAALQETERARADAVAAGQAKDQFLAVLSHELRTPLTPVMLAIQLLSRQRNLPDSAREHLAMIQRNVETEAHFIDDLLDITHITRGKLQIQQTSVDLHDVIREAIVISTTDIQAKHQELFADLTAEKVTIFGDGRRLQQVFWNILKNASKFTPESGPIHLRTWNEPDKVCVEISDSGVGFPPEMAERIFEAFTQANDAVSREFGGLGLGLAISKATIDAHGGELLAQSEGPGKGARFVLRLNL